MNLAQTPIRSHSCLEEASCVGPTKGLASGCTNRNLVDMAEQGGFRFRPVLPAERLADPRARLGPGEPVRIGPEELAHEFTPLPSRGRVPEASSSDAAGLADRVAELERSLIREAVDAAEGNWSQAAQALGLDRSNLLRKARRLGLRD